MVAPKTPTTNYEAVDPDVRLMLQVRDDNAAAFEELVLRYQGRVITLLEHVVGGREQAEDVAQEVFLRVFRARKTYRAEARFATWFFKIANNVASNSRRTLARRREVGVGGPRPDQSGENSLEEMATAASGWMPVRRADKTERAEVVREAIECLNERQRMAILLSKFEDMSYEDISETMGMSVKATKSLLSRARENLRVLLAPYMDQGVRPTAHPTHET